MDSLGLDVKSGGSQLPDLPQRLGFAPESLHPVDESPAQSVWKPSDDLAPSHLSTTIPSQSPKEQILQPNCPHQTPPRHYNTPVLFDRCMTIARGGNGQHLQTPLLQPLQSLLPLLGDYTYRTRSKGNKIEQGLPSNKARPCCQSGEEMDTKGMW